MAVEINPSEYKILIVDDTVTNVLLLQVILKNAKYNTISAASGQEALDKVESDTPDLILLDIMMPGMNGFEVAQILKSSETNKEIPIIFLTALNTSQDIVKGFKTGANDYISKPFNKEELLIRVNHQISLVAAKRAIDRQNEELRSTIMNRDRLVERAAELGERARARFRALGEKLPGAIKDVRGMGLLIGVDLALTPEQAKTVWATLLQRGYILNLTHGTVLRLLPPLIIDEADLIAFGDTLENVLKETLSARQPSAD